MGERRIPTVTVTTINRKICCPPSRCKPHQLHEEAVQFADAMPGRDAAAFLKKCPPCRIGHCKEDCDGRQFDPQESFVMKHIGGSRRESR
jgi:hypothetical protein